MKWEPYNYNGYRGRSTANEKLRVVAVVLAVLVVLALVALLLSQRYIVYSDNGLRLDAPFLQNTSQKQEDLTDRITVVVEPSDTPSEDGVKGKN